VGLISSPRTSLFDLRRKSMIQRSDKRYELTWSNKYLTSDAENMEDMIRSLAEAAKHLKAMLTDGVKLSRDPGIKEDQATLFTYNKDVADAYGFELVDDGTDATGDSTNLDEEEEYDFYNDPEIMGDGIDCEDD
jgi:hypothetical protein